jgi:hypothetical protein
MVMAIDETNWGAAEPIRQAIHDLVSKFQAHIGAPKPSDPPHADAGMVDAANQSFRDSAAKAKALSAEQAQKIRQKAGK